MSKRNKKKNANVASLLSRKEAFELTIYLFSEGGTESRYLQDISLKSKVKVIEQCRVSSPRVIVSKARDWAYDNRSLLLNSKSQVWALFDDDEKNLDIQQAIVEFKKTPKKCKTKIPAINVGYMKPCIELWGAMCITGNAESLPQMHVQMESKLKKIMRGYDHDGNRYFDVGQMKKTEKALDWAKAWEKQFGPFPDCVGHAPKFAGIYSLVERILAIS